MFLLHRCLLCIYGLADADGLREKERWAVSSKPRGHPVPNPRPPPTKEPGVLPAGNGPTTRGSLGLL